MKKIMSFILAAMIGGMAVASTVALNPRHPDKYVVVKGDTLWDIAGKFLKNPWQWPNIWQANQQIKNPHLIYPGDTLTLVWVNGKPQIRITRGRPTYKLTPQARIIPLKQAIPTIPLDAILPFLNRTSIIGLGELEKAPYIVSSADEHVISGAGDRVYVRGLSGDHSQYQVVRKGNLFRDPVTNEILGQEATYIGSARLQKKGDPATMLLTETTRETLSGDRLLKSNGSVFNVNFIPQPPSRNIKGHIISVADGVTQIGRYNVVVINRGTREGMKPGHVLSIYQKGEVVKDRFSGKKNDMVRLPEEHAGHIMVFRTFEKVSYALVMTATRAIHVNDVVKNP